MNNPFDELWQDERYWRGKLIYRCQKDPRLIVRAKVIWLGWTFNSAHKTSYLMLTALVLAFVIPTLSAIRENGNANLLSSFSLSLFFVVAILVTAYRVGRFPQN